MTRARALLVAAAAVAAICLFARLGSLPLIQPDEGRNAEVAREMKDAGAWLVPTYDGLPYLDKPALYFRLVALSMAALGETETAARLPAALAAAALLVLGYWFARRAYGERAGALAVLVVGTTPLVVAFARMVIFDMVLALCVTAAILAGYLAEEREGGARRAWYLVAAACAGLGTLVKGPVGFLLPPLVLLALNALDRRPGAVRRMFAPLNVALFLAVVLPWFVALSQRRPDFPYYGLVEESFHRFTTARQFHRGAPFWYYVPVILAVFFPWSVLLPEAAAAAWAARRRLARADRLLLAWVAVVVVFFSISQSKLPGYVLTGVVALGVLVSRVLDLAWAQPAGRAGALVRRAAVALAAIAAVGAVALAVLRASPAGPGLLGAGGSETERLAPALGPLAWSLAAIAAVAAVGRWRRSRGIITAAFALPPLLLLTVAFGGARAYAEAASGRALARRIPALPPAAELACLECLPNGVPFYLRRTVTLVTRDGAETTSNYVVFSLARAARWPPRPGVVPRDSLAAWLASLDHPVFLLANDRSHGALDTLAARRGAAVTPLVAGWWGALLEPGRRRGTGGGG